MGLLLGIAPLLRWRKHDVPRAPAGNARRAGHARGLAAGMLFVGSVPALVDAPASTRMWVAVFGIALLLWIVGVLVFYAPVTAVAAVGALVIIAGRGRAGRARRDAGRGHLRDGVRAGRELRRDACAASGAGWKHGVAYLGHMGVVGAADRRHRLVQVRTVGAGAAADARVAQRARLPADVRGHAARSTDGKDHAIIAVAGPDRNFTAHARFFWSEYNQGWMKNPHIERFLTKDLYISPLEMVGGRPARRGRRLVQAGRDQAGRAT